MAVKLPDIVEAVRTCHSESRPIRIRGGGLSAMAPVGGALDLSTSELRGIVEYRPRDLVCTARAGTPLVEIEDALREHRQRLPLAPWDRDGRGTIGGLFAAGADGLRARHGFRAADHLLGAQAVLGTGDVVRVGARVVKSVAGFDVARALVGSRGTLAVITEVTFRVEAIPAAEATWAGGDRCPLNLYDAGMEFSAFVSDRAEAWRDLVLVEGPQAHVDEVGAQLRDLGCEHIDSPWEDLTARAESPRDENGDRVVGLRPESEVPDGESWSELICDHGRGRWVGFRPLGSVPATETPSAHPTGWLLERIRAAFDPDGVFQPGRGFGAR
jgi:glycolate oxidase FAD binding subunit